MRIGRKIWPTSLPVNISGERDDSSGSFQWIPFVDSLFSSPSLSLSPLFHILLFFLIRYFYDRHFLSLWPDHHDFMDPWMHVKLDWTGLEQLTWLDRGSKGSEGSLDSIQVDLISINFLLISDLIDPMPYLWVSYFSLSLSSRFLPSFIHSILFLISNKDFHFISISSFSISSEWLKK